MNKRVQKKIFIFIWFFFFLLVPLTGWSYSEESTESIKSFKVTLEVNRDSSLLVTENILYDFKDNLRHGIYRNIPINYERAGADYKLHFSIVSVTDEFGNDYKYRTIKKGGEVQIKIGDLDKYVSGLKHYKITYQLKQAINYFDDHDELYWNVTGNEWDVVIEEAQAQVSLPVNVDSTKVRSTCYTGLYGVSEQNCSSRILNAGVAEFATTRSLESGEGLTLVLGFPKGVVKEPNVFLKVSLPFISNFFLFLPILVFIVLLRLWLKRGRDPQARGTIIPLYEPPANLTAGEIGAIVDEKFNPRDIVAAIIGLAVKGYLKIREVESRTRLFKSRDWKFFKLEKPVELLEEYEKELLKAIFSKSDETLLSSLKLRFPEEVEDINKSLYHLLVKKEFFPQDPSFVRNLYLVIGFITLFSSIFTLAIIPSIYLVISFALSGILFIIFSRWMPRKTLKGRQAHEAILGFKMYLKVAEKDRIKFHNAPEKKPEIFENFLPYAIALGVEKEWAKQFKDIYTTPPSWYEGRSGAYFSSIYLVNSLSGFSKGVMTFGRGGAGGGHSGFGGGGFSGGGFGGGGGGSW